jgi:hypothetical protein
MINPVDLVSFLLARVAEEHAAARAAGNPRGVIDARVKRWVVAEHMPVSVPDQPTHCRVCRRADDPLAGYVLSPCPTLRFLAFAYADHPDYRKDWRP